MNERINVFINSLGISVSEFERICNLSNGAVSKMGDNTRMSTIDKISKIYPNLNTAWLRTGEGEMLKSQSPATLHHSQQASGSGITQTMTPSAEYLSEISEMRKLLQEQIRHNQEQFERLTSIIEHLTSK